MAFINFAAVETFQPFLDAITRPPGHMILSGLDSLHIDGDFARDLYAEVCRAASHVRGIGAGHQRFGRCATGIDAGTAKELALNHRYSSSRAGQTICQRRSCLAGSDDDGIVASHWIIPLIVCWRARTRYSAASSIFSFGS
jgi:hypothetical protein